MTPPDNPGTDEDDPWQSSGQLPANPSDLPDKASWLRRTRGLIATQWSPHPLPSPQVDPDFEQLSMVERSAEVFRYCFSKAEYWLSPGGLLREWIRVNIRITLALLLPALLVAPLVTYALRQFSIWTDLLTATTSKMVLFPLSALLVVGLVYGLIHLTKAIHGQPRHRHPNQYYE